MNFGDRKLSQHTGEIAMYVLCGRLRSVVQRTLKRQHMAASVILEVPVVKRTPPRELTDNDYSDAGGYSSLAGDGEIVFPLVTRLSDPYHCPR